MPYFVHPGAMLVVIETDIERQSSGED
jgi:hypothetical protein